MRRLKNVSISIVKGGDHFVPMVGKIGCDESNNVDDDKYIQRESV